MSVVASVFLWYWSGAYTLRRYCRNRFAPGWQLFVADLLVAFWLFGPYEPLQGGAPWYYGNLSGLENADYLVVPKCGFVPEARNIIIDELNASDIPLSTVADTELLALFAVGQP